MKSTNIANITAAMHGAPPILQGAPTSSSKKYGVEPGRCITRDGKPSVSIHRCLETCPVEADDLCHSIAAASNLENETVARMQTERGQLLVRIHGLEDELKRRGWTKAEWQTASVLSARVSLLRTALVGVARELAHWHEWRHTSNDMYRGSEGAETCAGLIKLANDTLEATGGGL